MRKIVMGLLFLVAFCSKAQGISYTGSKVSVKDADKFMEHHNSVRDEVGVPNLSWNPKLAKVAQKYANLLASKKCSLKHSQNPKYGENLFMGNGTVYTAVDASKAWYKEKRMYSYSKIGYNNYKTVGHYTQMIWKNTTDVGVGVAICKDGSYIFVANYFPKGNYIGKYPY
ncbi:CAP domain-containing protein [Flavobacterium maritimum]|uniref:CAP domain-containing protein n=1 Tax=Flavobacterium maritimum TaxID=3149042 RepID=UPI0032B598E3